MGCESLVSLEVFWGRFLNHVISEPRLKLVSRFLERACALCDSFKLMSKLQGFPDKCMVIEPQKR
jgi:hypothetical protein